MSVLAIIFFVIIGVILVIVGFFIKRYAKKILVKENKPNREEKLQASDWYLDLEKEMTKKEKEEDIKNS